MLTCYFQRNIAEHNLEIGSSVALAGQEYGMLAFSNN